MDSEKTIDVVGETENDENVINEKEENDKNDKNVRQSVDITEESKHNPQDTMVEQISQAIFDGKPRPSEHVVAEMRAEADLIITSPKGVQFDPEKHAAGVDGKPLCFVKGVKKGEFKPLKKIGLTKTSDKYHAGMTDPNQAGIMLAGVFLTMTQTIGLAIGGSEEAEAWKPQNNMEQLMIDNAFINYANAKEIRDMPPTFGLIFAITMFSLPRLTRPQPRSKIKSTSKSIFKWFSKTFKKGGNSAQHDTRSNLKRKNSNGEETRE